MTRIDPLDRLRAADPFPDLTVEPSRALREAIMVDADRGDRANRTPRTSRLGRGTRSSQPIGVHKRRLIVGIAVAAVAAMATTAAAVTYLDVRETTSIDCVFGDTRDREGAIVSAGIDATTGDPVADCGALWQRQTGSPPPPLTAYDDGRGSVIVMPASEPAPRRYTRLPTGPVQSAILIELDNALADHVDGLEANCYSDAQAIAVARRILARVGLPGWEVHLREGHADGRTSCSRYMYLEAGEKKVELDALPGSPQQYEDSGEPTPAWRRLPEQIREALATCRSLAAATDEITRRAATVGYPVRPDELTIEQVPDPAATCARADMVVGGSVRIILRGPAGQ